jgi:hypothetical protein
VHTGRGHTDAFKIADGSLLQSFSAETGNTEWNVLEIFGTLLCRNDNLVES